MVGFGFFLLVAILCGPGIVPTLLGALIYEKSGLAGPGRGTSGGIGALIIWSAFLTIPITGGGIIGLTQYGHASLAAAWSIIYLSAWLSYAAIIFAHWKETE